MFFIKGIYNHPLTPASGYALVITCPFHLENLLYPMCQLPLFRVSCCPRMADLQTGDLHATQNSSYCPTHHVPLEEGEPGRVLPGSQLTAGKPQRWPQPRSGYEVAQVHLERGLDLSADRPSIPWVTLFHPPLGKGQCRWLMGHPRDMEWGVCVHPCTACGIFHVSGEGHFDCCLWMLRAQ